MVAHIIFDRNTEEEKHLQLSGYLNQVFKAILKALQDLASMSFTGWTPIAKLTQLHKFSS